MDSHDLIIVGGGIGGSALATVMARAGADVLLLERSEVFEDQVRGEWLAPWGVVEARRLDLLGLLEAAGGHYLSSHVSYDPSVPARIAEAAALSLADLAPDVAGPLCIGHPRHCQTLFDAATAAGARTRRGVDVLAVEGLGAGSPAAAPAVRYVHEGVTHEARARLVVGADGRSSRVREAAGVVLHADRPHHWFAGMLVEAVEGWDEGRQAVGVEGALNYLAFPQGGGRVRLYGGYGLSDHGRFAGPQGPRRSLDAFRVSSCPGAAAIAAGRPAGPLRAYANDDSWTDAPFAPGAVLVGDAAGWNDPIIGQGLSITYRDVRIVSDLLRQSPDWAPALFAPYGEERRERMRRLRFVAALLAELDAEFEPAACERRADFFRRAAGDMSLFAHVLAVMSGPETAAAEVFTDAYRARVLGGEALA